jgi:hypothetical protein
LLNNLVAVFNHRNLSIFNVEGGITEKDMRGKEQVQFRIVYEDTQGQAEGLIHELQTMDYGVIAEQPPTVPYFPVKLKELDNLKQELLPCGQDELSGFFNAPQYRD